MRSLVKAEFYKQKHSFTNKAALVAPVMVLMLVLLLTGGVDNSFSSGAWNWWYFLFLPATLAICCYQVVWKDKKINYHSVFSLPVKPIKIWMGKILLCCLYLFVGNVILGIGSIIGGFILGTYISVSMNISAIIVLTLVYMWEIPLFLLLSAKGGLFASVGTGVAMAIVGVILAPTRFWWTFISAMPIRAMCPVIAVMPNGLPVEVSSYYLDYSCLLIIIPVTLVAFLLLSFGTGKWFSKREERK